MGWWGVCHFGNCDSFRVIDNKLWVLLQATERDVFLWFHALEEGMKKELK